MNAKSAMKLALEALEGIELYEAHTGKSRHREWALCASMWLHPGEAVANVNEMKIKEAIDALVIAMLEEPK